VEETGHVELGGASGWGWGWPAWPIARAKLVGSIPDLHGPTLRSRAVRIPSQFASTAAPRVLLQNPKTQNALSKNSTTTFPKKNTILDLIKIKVY
jgi:hypothetical protein